MAKVIIEGPGGALASTDLLQDINLTGNFAITGGPIVATNLDLDHNKITNLADPTSDQDAVNQRTLFAYTSYSPATLAFLPPSTTWTANNYLGLGSAAATTGIPAWVANIAGQLVGFRFYSGVHAAPGDCVFTFYKAPYSATGSGSFAEETATISLTNGNKQAFNNLDVISVLPGDIIIVKTDTTFSTGAAGGFSITASFITNPQF